MWTIPIVIVFVILLHAINAALWKGYVEEYNADRRFTCSGKQTSTATSEIQCIHRCLRIGKCSIANYKQNTNGNTKIDNCETFHVPSYHESCSSKHSVGWKGLVFWVS